MVIPSIIINFMCAINLSIRLSLNRCGASDLIASVFGEAGMHTRAAVSTNSLPLGVSVEVDAIFELN